MPEIADFLKRKEIDGLPITIIHRGGIPVKIPAQKHEYVKDNIRVITEILEDIVG